MSNILLTHLYWISYFKFSLFHHVNFVLSSFEKSIVGKDIAVSFMVVLFFELLFILKQRNYFSVFIFFHEINCKIITSKLIKVNCSDISFLDNIRQLVFCIFMCNMTSKLVTFERLLSMHCFRESFPCFITFVNFFNFETVLLKLFPTF